jgi:hypothetical protein
LGRLGIPSSGRLSPPYLSCSSIYARSRSRSRSSSVRELDESVIVYLPLLPTRCQTWVWRLSSSRSWTRTGRFYFTLWTRFILFFFSFYASETIQFIIFFFSFFTVWFIILHLFCAEKILLLFFFSLYASASEKILILFFFSETRIFLLFFFFSFCAGRKKTLFFFSLAASEEIRIQFIR